MKKINEYGQIYEDQTEEVKEAETTTKEVVKKVKVKDEQTTVQ